MHPSQSLRVQSYDDPAELCARVRRGLLAASSRGPAMLLVKLVCGGGGSGGGAAGAPEATEW
jgi:hypothetical protein